MKNHEDAILEDLLKTTQILSLEKIHSSMETQKLQGKNYRLKEALAQNGYLTKLQLRKLYDEGND